MVAAVLSPLAKLLLKKGYKKGAGLFQGLNVRAPFKGKEVSEVVRRGPKFNKQIEKEMKKLYEQGVDSPTLMARLLGGKLGSSQIKRIMTQMGMKTTQNINKKLEPSLINPRTAGTTKQPMDVSFPTKEIEKQYIKDLKARSLLPQRHKNRLTDKDFADKYFPFSTNNQRKMVEVNAVLRKKYDIPEKPLKYGSKAEESRVLSALRREKIKKTSDPTIEKKLSVARKEGVELSHMARDADAVYSKTLGYAPGRLNRGAMNRAENQLDEITGKQEAIVKNIKNVDKKRNLLEKLNLEKTDIVLGKFDPKIKGQLGTELYNIDRNGRLTKSVFGADQRYVVDPLNLTKGAKVKDFNPFTDLNPKELALFEATRLDQIQKAKDLNTLFVQKYGKGFEDGGSVGETTDQVIERMFNDHSAGGIVGGGQYGGVPITAFNNSVSTIESILAGIGAGLIDIPKGAFSLGASLIDLGLGTDHAAKVEKFFDDLTTLDEKAEQTLAGNLTRIITNLGIPGAQGFKLGSSLAKQAMVARKANKYFKINKRMQPRMEDALNAQGRLLTTLGGAAGVGVADAIFVGDPEQVGTIGDMFESGPTALKQNTDDDAAREVMNRMKFGLESSLLLGLIGATGSAIKTGIKRGDDLKDNNGIVNKFLAKFRPRGDKPQDFFDLERGQIGQRSADLNRAQEIQRGVDKEIDAIFPFIKKGLDKTPEAARKDFYKQLNDVLLSGPLEVNPIAGVRFFKGMDKTKLTKLVDELKAKGVPQKNIDGLIGKFEDARAQFGDMFTALGGRMDEKQLKQFADTFAKKAGDYLDSTYAIFGNAGVAALRNFKPGDEAVDQGMELVKALYKDKTKSASQPLGKTLTDEQAEHYVQKIIETAEPPQRILTKEGRAQGVTIASDEAFMSNKTVLGDIEEIGSKIGVNQLTDDIVIDGKKYNPRRVVQELLGKVDDPNRTILASASKLSLLTRRNEFLDALVKTSDDAAVGKKFLYDDELQARLHFGRENVRRINMDPAGRLQVGEMINPVNGKFTSKAVADALEETSKNILGDGALSNIYNNFILYPKATSQLAKTVLSPITHFRNFVSAGAFAAGNGIIPNLEAFQTAFKSLQTPLKGTREQNEFYRKLLRLGVVNSNVRLGDLQRLLTDVNFGATVSSMPALKRLAQAGSRLKKGAEEFYTAEDDFWKITSFAMERQRYDQAFRKAGIIKSADELDELAASIVRNNIPNYDYVNDFVKGLRKFPVGNFVSFPAEIMRTSANIIKRAVDDIKFVDEATGTAPLRNLGYQRLFGFGLTAVAIPYGTVEAAKALYNVSEDEMDALKRFVPSWSKNSTLVPIRGDDGELKYIDFSHANAYDTMIRPITTIINNIQNGDEDRTIIQNIFTGMFKATEETLSPFVSEAIWTQAATDIFLRGGRTRDGRRLYTEQTPLGEKVYITAGHLVESQLPGSIEQFKRIGLSVVENPDKYGREYEFGDELAGVLGFRTVQVDPINSMKFKIADFRTGINNSRREFTSPLLRGGPVTPEDIVDRYQVANRQLYKVQREMTKDYYAALTLGSTPTQIDREFDDRVSKVQLAALKAGRFKPFIPSENIKSAFAENARAIGSANPYAAASSEINRLAREYGRINYLTEKFPLFDNPFGGLDISLPSAISPGNLPSVVGGQLPTTIGAGTANTAQKGQTVFGPLDPIFGGS
mgnify:CR=1 FL=1